MKMTMSILDVALFTSVAGYFLTFDPFWLAFGLTAGIGRGIAERMI